MNTFLKTFLISAVVLAGFANSALAVPTTVERPATNDHIEPRISTDFIKASYFTASSTTATSTIPKLRKGEILIKYPDGTEEYVVATTSSDVGNGTALVSALGKAYGTSTLMVGPGVYDLQTGKILNLSKNNTANISLFGSGKYQTTFVYAGKTVTEGCLISPASYTTLQGFTASTTYVDGFHECPFGETAAGLAKPKDAINVILKDVRLMSIDDGFYFECSSVLGRGTCIRKIYSYNVDILAKWDTLVVSAPSVASSSGSVFVFVDSNIEATGGSPYNGRDITHGPFVGSPVANGGYSLQLYNTNVTVGGADTENINFATSNGGELIIEGGTITNTGTSTATNYIFSCTTGNSDLCDYSLSSNTRLVYDKSQVRLHNTGSLQRTVGGNWSTEPFGYSSFLNRPDANYIVAPTSTAATAVYGSGNYLSANDFLGAAPGGYYYIWSYKTLNGVRYYSDDFAFATSTDDGQGTPFYWRITWSGVPGVDGYRVYRYDNPNGSQLGPDPYSPPAFVDIATTTTGTVYLHDGDGTEATFNQATSTFNVLPNSSKPIAYFSAGGQAYLGNKVGIGTTTPYAALSVVGETVSTYFTATSTTATSTLYGGFSQMWNDNSIGACTSKAGIRSFRTVGLFEITGCHETGTEIFKVGSSADGDATYLSVVDTGEVIIGGSVIRPATAAGTNLGQSTVPFAAGYFNNMEIYATGLTQGSVVFGGISGKISQDNANFFFNDTNNFLGLGTTSPYGKLSVSGHIVGEYFSATSTTATSTFSGPVNGLIETFCFALSDETTPLVTSSTTVTWRAPYDATLTNIRLSVASTSIGATITVNLKESGTTIFSTRPTIDANEKTSVTAASTHAFSDTSLADDNEMTWEIDQVGTTQAGTGLKACAYMKRR